MRLRPLLALAALAASTAVAADPAPPAAPPASATAPLAPFQWLAGSCWNGSFSDGRTRDLVCYEWMLGGRFLRSRHRILGGERAYSGETVYGRDAAGGGLAFTYFNSDGETLRGAIVPTAEGFSFPEESVDAGGKSLRLRSVWRRSGPDRYLAVTERLDGDLWRPMMTVDFVRGGPASDWREAD
ncbi:MAG: hypothetical protein U0X73_11050 [Thermoanaerobaculia bacterium]